MFGPADIARQLALSRILYGMFGLAAGALLFTKVEVVVTAYGRLSSDNIQYYVDSLRDGRVQDVLVRSGVHVAGGEPLLRYDCTVEEEITNLNQIARRDTAEQIRKELDRAALLLPTPQAEALEQKLRSKTQALPPTLLQEVQRFRAELGDIKRRAELDDQKFAVAGNLVDIERDRAARRLRQAEREYARFSSLAQSGAAADSALEKAGEALSDAQETLRAKTFEIESNSVARERVAEENRKTISNLQTAVVTRLTELDDRYHELERQFAEQVAKKKLCEVSAPTEGVVFWLEQISQDRFVKAGDRLGMIVRTGVPIVAEAELPEENIAFVAPNQRAMLRINGLPFVRYGTLSGHVTFVSPDRARPEQSSGYQVNLAIDDSPTWLRETGVRLVPGMAIEADIIVGQRRVIEYLTEPLQRAFRTAFREI